MFHKLQSTWHLLSPTLRRSYFRIILSSFLITLLEFMALIVLYLIIGRVLEIETLRENFFLFNGLEYLDENQMIMALLGALFVIYLVKNIATYLLSKLQITKAYKISELLSENLFKSTLYSSFTDNKESDSNERINEVNTFTALLSNQVILPSVSLFSEMLFLLITLVFLLAFHWKLTLFLIILLVPSTWFLMKKNRLQVDALGRTVHAARSKLNVIVSQSVLAFPEIKLHKNESNLLEKYREARREVYQSNKQLYLLNGIIPQRLFETIILFALAILGFYVALSNQTNQLLGLIALFTAFAFRVLPSINRIVNSVNSLNSYRYLMDFIRPVAQENQLQKAVVDSFPKEIKFQNVQIRFGVDKPIFDQINFTIKEGDFVGILGPSGAGKTTLVNILLGFLPPDNGQVLLDDFVLNTQNVESWQSYLAYIRQDVYLSSESIQSNILFGATLDPQLLNEVLEQSQLTEWVSTLPKGVETTIGEFGNKISGGQRQRIAIARALYKRAKLIVFDEATTGLDETTKSAILETIIDLSQQKTIVIVSHDTSVTKHCRKILTIHNGQISA